jgi:hypothetical protein
MKSISFEVGENTHTHNMPFTMKELYTQFETIPMEGGSHFGILQCEVDNDTVSLDMEYEFMFMLDRSGSMNQRCADRKTKLQHVIHTMKNILGYLCDHPTVRHHLVVDTFDDVVTRIIDRCVVNAETYSELVRILDQVTPNGSTNIEAALASIQRTSTSMAMATTAGANRKIVHLFMTDGYATVGETDNDRLVGQVTTDITNVFIGLGIDHDNILLEKLSDVKHGSYYFIDALEKNNLVYGEIMHEVLFQCLQNVHIQVTQGEIYDYTKNQWLDTLSLDHLSCGANKTFHLRSASPADCRVTFMAETISGEPCIALLLSKHSLVEAGGLTKYHYRQRTLEHLYEARTYFRHHISGHHISGHHHLENVMVKKNLKDKLTAFLEELKQYRFEKELMEDPFYALLEEDISVILKTFDTNYASMYSCARQTSQGSQRGYSCASTIGVAAMPSLRRCISQADMDIDITQVANFTSPYMSQAVAQFTQKMERR